MKPKNNKRWTKRKHKNGKRPERMGCIRINLSKLPSASKILELRFKYTGLNLTKRMPKHPELDFKNWYGEENQRRLRQFQHETEQWARWHDQWQAVYDRLVSAYEFLESYEQIAPRNLAMGFINNTQDERIGGGSQLADERAAIASAWEIPNN